MVNGSVADWIHIDVMDGHFVPNLTFGFHIISQIKKRARKPLDVHLMISNAEQYIERYIESGADYLTVHYEATTHLHRTMEQIRSLGAGAGISVNPSTPVMLLREILPYADLVLNMTVNPGFGGQAFIESSYGKIRELKALIRETGSPALIQVDGGVGLHNIRKLIDAGVNVFVVGNTVFSADDPPGMIRKLKNPPAEV